MRKFAPLGFEAPADPAVAQSLKYRNFIVSRPIPPPRLRQADLAEEIVTFAVAARSLLDFGWSAIDRARGARSS